MRELLFEKCKNCGAPLNIGRAENGVLECEYCGSTFTVPKEETNKGAIEQLKIALNELDLCRFEGAFSAYQKAAELDKDEPEAYFGMALAEFRVQYLKDHLKHRLQPICHAVTEKKFTENKNYLHALLLATNEQKAEYERRAAEIDYIASEFYRLKEQGVKYDCFLCVKVTDDETGMRTADYKYADDIYFSLRGKGYKPFFSERELKNVTGADYEARILYALWCSECMLVVCGKEEYLSTPWVKNEYTRFLALIRDEEKESDSIAIAFHGKPIEKLAGKNGRLQGIDLGAMDATERVTAFVEAHTPEAKKRREEEESKKRAAEEELVKKLEEQQRAQREIEEQLKNLRKTAAVAAAPAGVVSNAEKLLVRAKQELDFGDFATAAKYYQQAIDTDPENGEAWFGAFLTEYKVKNEEELVTNLTLDDIQKIHANKNYLFAVKNASGELKAKLEIFEKELNGQESRILEEKAERERKAKEAAEEAEAKRLLKYEDPSVDCYNPNEFVISRIGIASRTETGRMTVGYGLVKCKATRTHVKLPRGVRFIGDGQSPVSASELPIREVEIPESVVEIKANAFARCYNLTKVEFAANSRLQKIGQGAFSNTNLKSIIIPDSVTVIDTTTFAYCKSLESIVIPSRVTEIGFGAFLGCDRLNSVVIPNSVQTMEISAFEKCTSIRSVTMPISLKRIGKKVFKESKFAKFTFTK